ncbi:MAG: hypothetical protein JSV03_17495, partial [Planctomycetota bacterium]
EHDNIRVLVVRDHEGDPMGATVIFVDQHNKKRIAFVEELFSLPGRHDVIRTLLSAALALAFDQEADYLVTMSGNPSNMRILKELGFESKIRPTAAASIHIPDQITKNTSPFISYEAMNEHLELWHGEMFKS